MTCANVLFTEDELQEAGATLAKIERNGHPELAAKLRGLFQRISSRTPEEAEAMRRTELEADRRTALARLRIPELARLTILGPQFDLKHPTLMLLRDSVRGSSELQADPLAPRIVVLVGRSGRGKTVAACVWLLEQSGLFVQASHVASLNEHLRDDRAELYALQSSRTLVVDDLGRGAENGEDRKRVSDLLCQRSDNGLWTVCTSNEVPKYGEAIVRRMRVVAC